MRASIVEDEIMCVHGVWPYGLRNLAAWPAESGRVASACPGGPRGILFLSQILDKAVGNQPQQPRLLDVTPSASERAPDSSATLALIPPSKALSGLRPWQQ